MRLLVDVVQRRVDEEVVADLAERRVVERRTRAVLLRVAGSPVPHEVDLKHQWPIS